jgi:ABC-type branched-subunit amino acid transport system substrate-binding protein
MKKSQSLAEYISKHHSGNNSDFARSIGVERNQVQQWLNAKKPVYVIDGKLVQVIRELKDY